MAPLEGRHQRVVITTLLQTPNPYGYLRMIMYSSTKAVLTLGSKYFMVIEE
jgi:hypothetical protein